MNNLAPFLIRYLHGNAGIEEIHTDIERWQEHVEGIGYSFDPGPELHDWLGLLPSEYQMFRDNEWKFVRYLDHLKNGSENHVTQ